jgi:hypothetical protein
MLLASILLLLAFGGAPSTEREVTGLPLTGDEAVEFLQTAKVLGRPEKFDSVAITDPLRVTLTDGTRTLRAIFKDEDTNHMVFHFADGKVLTGVKDSYRHEIAAYELDVLLGLGIVPPCVKRPIRRDTGSLCLWVENAMTEAVRQRKKIRPPDLDDWNGQMFTIRLFHQLTWDPDYNNISNTLVDANFKLYKVDSSMAFRTDPKLRNEKALTRFSKSVLASLEALERSEVEARLGPWLNRKQLDALWARRARLLELAREQIALRGEVAVLSD